MKRIIQVVVILSTIIPTSASFSRQVALHDTARFLAGKTVSRSSPLYRLTQTARHRRYGRRMRAYWNRYRRTTVRPIRAWRRRWLSEESREFCFYPFSGGDFINAYNFFPKAKTILMIGLEQAGRIPNFVRMPSWKRNKGYRMMVQGYRIFVRYNFYRTLGMRVFMDRSPFTGTIPHILSQMAWMGLKPVAAYAVGVRSGGKLTFRRIRDSRFRRRMAIDFLDKNGIRRRVIYLRLDMRNSSLRRKPRWRAYLRSLRGTSGFLKAATCLPPRHNYTIINRIMLRVMDVIVQSDSGIAYRHLKRNFKITLFGRYYRAHSLFPSWSQPQLRRAYRRAPYRRLPFKFSYDRPGGRRRNMMLVKRK